MLRIYKKMSFNFFGFGRKTVRKGSKTVRKGRKVAKPPSSLIKMCKRYGVKTSKKVGSKRVYKKLAILKRQCAKKIRKLIKKHKASKRHSQFGTKGRRGSGRRGAGRRGAGRRGGGRRGGGRRGGGIVEMTPMAPVIVKKPSFSERVGGHFRRNKGRYFKTLGGVGTLAALYGGSVGVRAARNGGVNFDRSDLVKSGARLAGSARGVMAKDRMAVMGHYGKLKGGINSYRNPREKTDFGKGRRRTYRFGNGGNPSLNQIMGNEFCSNGGGVLGADSTGLFPTPCKGSVITNNEMYMNNGTPLDNQELNPINDAVPSTESYAPEFYTGSNAPESSNFGKRRRPRRY